MSQSKGIVYLIGAGPGEPGLVTLHGRDTCRVLATAGLDASLLRGLERGAEVVTDGAAELFGTEFVTGR